MRLSLLPFAAAVLLSFAPLSAQTLGLAPEPAPKTAGEKRAAYDARLAEAKKRAAEKSWALAREAYAAALPFAPDAEAKRWCELWVLDATWRSGVPQKHGEYADVVVAFEKLLAPYAKTSERDDYWVAVIESLAAAKRAQPWHFRNYKTPGTDELAVAEYLAAQPETPAAAARYAAFLGRLTELDDRYFEPTADWRERLMQHRMQAARVIADPVARARWMVRTADFAAKEAVSSERCARLYADALEAAKGTVFQPLAEAREFLWRADNGRLTPDAKRRPDLPAWLVEIERLQIALTALPVEEPLRQPALKQLNDLRITWTERHVEFSIEDIFRPEERVRFTVGAAYVGQMGFEVHRLSPADWAKIHQGVHGEGMAELPMKQDKVLGWELKLTADVPAHLWQTRVMEIPEALAPGMYVLAVRDDLGRYRVRRFAVSSVAGTMVTLAENRRELFCYDSKAYAPVAPMTRAVAWLGSAKNEKPGDPITLTADANGRFVLGETGLKHFQTATLVIEGMGPVMLGESYSSWRGDGNAEGDALHLDLFLPRELYRPGETVPFKLIGRHRRDHRFVKPEGKLTLKALLDDVPVGASLEMAWDEDGAMTGEIAIPVGTRPGRVELSLFKGAEEVETVEFFTVDSFLPPPAFVSLDLAGDVMAVRRGGQMTFRVSAKYFSGGPLVGAPVEFGVRPDVFSLERENEDERGVRDAWVAEMKRKTFRGVTDAGGVATFSVELPEFLPPVFWLTPGYTVKPAGLPEMRGSEAMVATESGLRLEIAGGEKPRVVAPGEQMTLRFRYLDARGKPAPVSGEVSLIESCWQEVWLDPEGRAVTGGALIEARKMLELPAGADLPGVWKKIHAETETGVVATEAPVAGADGWASVTFTVPRAGVYHFDFNAESGRVVAVDERMFWEKAGKPALVYAVDAATRTLALKPDREWLIAPDDIGAGEKPRFLVIMPEGIRRGWLAVSGEKETRTQAFTSEGRVTLVTFDDPPLFSAQGEARLITARAERYYAGTEATFAVRHPAETIRTEIVGVPDGLRPGSRGEVTLRTSDHERRPVSATVALGVSDQAVNELLSKERESVPAFLGFDGHVRCSVSTSRRWEKKAWVVRLADPRRGLEFYEAVTSGEDEVILNAFSIPAGRAGGGSMGAMSVTAGSGGTEGASSRVVSADLSSRSDGIIEKPARPEPTSTVLGQVFGAEPKPVVTLRRHFVSTAFWAPGVKTDAKGEARVAFTFPDNLTEWRLAAYAIGKDGNSFGTATAFAKTTLPFQTRLSAPRFLVAGDMGTATGMLVNRTASEAKAEATIAVAGDAVRLAEREKAERTALAVSANGETRTTWSVQAKQPGTTVMTLSAHTPAEGDAMELSVPVMEDGIQQKTATSVRLRAGEKTARLSVELPVPLDAARTEVELRLSPSRAAAVLDALPYLIEYPYGCVEQTMSRFLPVVVVKKMLSDLGFDEATIKRRMLARETAKQAARREKTAGFAKLDDVVTQSLARLVAAQSYDGSFGWWPGQKNADLWMTAYVAWGLALADEAGVEVPEKLSEETNDALGKLLKHERQINDTVAWALAAVVRVVGKEMDAKAVEGAKAVFTRLYEEREKLSASGRACLLLAVKLCGTEGQRAVLLRNLENGAARVVSGDFGDTVQWGSERGYWRASEGSVETTALTLLALLESEPGHVLIEPAVNWLVLNRGSGGWSNTRDTAFAVLALSRFLSVSREAEPDAVVEIVANGKVVRRVTLDRASLLEGPAVTLEASSLKAGENQVELRRVGGKSPVYGLALMSAWATGEAVKPAGHLLEAGRTFDRQKARATLAGTLHFTPEAQPVNGSAMEGEQVVARVALTVPNDLEYVMVEVPKPAGCEPLNPLSGWDARLVRIGKSGTALAVSGAGGRDEMSADGEEAIYREEHDDKSVFFIDRLDAGNWEIRFGLRAVHRGDYRALPVQAEAMYAPEVRANSDARRLRIEAGEAR
ncbi:alpha-2-macroglobulin family protein [Nibricoccus aquaticus]|nr:alpha-2-macroglobulin family protein [Nibricoccus aquaticus]